MRNFVGIASKNEASDGIIVISAEVIAEQQNLETVQMLLVFMRDWVSTPKSRPDGLIYDLTSIQAHVKSSK
jgi:hypothetical protein